MLARREHSQAELFKKLRLKKFPADLIKPILEELTEKGFLSNNRFIEMYLRSRRNKGVGPLRIKLELNERGVTNELIEQHIDITDNAWLTDVALVWQKHFKNKLPRDFKERAKQIRFLLYRGFTQDQIKSVLQEAQEIE